MILWIDLFFTDSISSKWLSATQRRWASRSASWAWTRSRTASATSTSCATFSRCPNSPTNSFFATADPKSQVVLSYVFFTIQLFWCTVVKNVVEMNKIAHSLRILHRRPHRHGQHQVTISIKKAWPFKKKQTFLKF